MNLRKTIIGVAATAAIAALGSSPALASHIPGMSFSGTPFRVNPMAVGEAFPEFTAGAINFSYTAEVDQSAGAGAPGVPGTTSAFTETGVADFGAFLASLGGTSLGAGDTGLNLSSTTTAGYSLFATFSGAGTATLNTTGGIDGVFTTFNVNVIVDRDNDSSISCPAPGAPNGTCMLADAGGAADDSVVLRGTLVVGQGGFHVNPGITGGDFDVKFLVTENTVGFFTFDTVPVGTPGEISGVNSLIEGATPPPFAFVDAIITGSGNVVFETALPEPSSLTLLGLGLLGFGFASRRRKTT